MLTVSLLLARQEEILVAVYNETDDPWPSGTTWVGQESRSLPPLQPHQGASARFQAVRSPLEVKLSVPGHKPVDWSAPFLARPNVKQLTVHINREGEPTVTVEERFFAKLTAMLD